jgi:RimJ/RimL family protein N-acetyltransferase
LTPYISCPLRKRTLLNPLSLNGIVRSQLPKETLAESKEWLEGSLPSPENPDVDKYAILLKPVEENPKPWVNEKGKPKMIGMTGTNRYSDEGMETGYCINIAYWGKGYAGEAFSGFLSLFWSQEERKQIKQLVAKIDAGNVPSQKIIQRVGAVKAGVLKEWYSRAVDRGVKRDIEYWFIDRPGVSEEEMREWKEEVKRLMVRKKELERAKEEREKAGKESGGGKE